MAANLVRTYSSDDARHLLNLSFAQYQADRDVVRLEARLERRRQPLAELRAKAQSEFGDIDEYRRLREQERDERSAGTDGASSPRSTNGSDHAAGRRDPRRQGQRTTGRWPSSRPRTARAVSDSR